MPPPSEVFVRPMAVDEVSLMVDYFLDAPAELHERMGVEPARLPERDWWIEHVQADLMQPMDRRKYLYFVAVVEGIPVAHCNVSKVVFGVEAYMHLHVWETGDRLSGVGTEMVRQSLPLFCSELQLPVIYCEPKASNEGPNRTLAKAGFDLVKTYRTTPGWLNYEQEVNRWEFSCSR